MHPHQLTDEDGPVIHLTTDICAGFLLQERVQYIPIRV